MQLARTYNENKSPLNENKSPRLLPAGWESLLEALYADVIGADEAFTGAEQGSAKNPAYLAACEKFVNYVHYVFGSSEKFDHFMQAEVLFALQAKGYDAQIPERWTNDPSYTYANAGAEADDLWVTYKLIYQRLINAASCLPEKPASSQNNLEYHA